MSLAHRKRLHGLAEQSTYGFELLQELDRLRAAPIEYSFLRVLNLFYLDRFLTVAILLGAWVGAGARRGSRSGHRSCPAARASTSRWSGTSSPAQRSEEHTSELQ